MQTAIRRGMTSTEGVTSPSIRASQSASSPKNQIIFTRPLSTLLRPGWMLGLALTMAIGASPLRVHAQSLQDSPRLDFYLVAGGLGAAKPVSKPPETTTTSTGGSAFEQFAPGGEGEGIPMGASVGLGIRSEFPVSEFFALGAFIEVTNGSLQGEVCSERDPAYFLETNVDAWFKLRWSSSNSGSGASSGSRAYEIYLGVPFGLSITWPHYQDELFQNQNWYGWNVGSVAGVSFAFANRASAMAELGWRHQQSYNRCLCPSGDPNALAPVDVGVRRVSNQLIARVGVGLLF